VSEQADETVLPHAHAVSVQGSVHCVGGALSNEQASRIAFAIEQAVSDAVRREGCIYVGHANVSPSGEPIYAEELSTEG
jgi:hypothetical protein